MPSRVPKTLPLAPAQMKALPIAPVEGFVLSRIDGTASEQELSALTGLPSDQITQTLDKLAGLGVITFGDVAAAQAPPRPEPAPSPIVAPSGLYDPAELDEEVDIPREHRVAVLDRFYQLADLNHYELLGLPRTAEKKEIRSAYFEAASLFHPDRHFRKKLGSFKAKMEAIFSRITLAHDTLRDAEKRAEYDAYLGDLDSTRALEKQLEPEPERATDPPLSAIPPPPASSPIPPAPPSAPLLQRPATPAISEQARRDALARRLTAGRVSSTLPPSPTTPPPNPASDPAALKRHYEERVTAVRERLARDHLTSAREAVKREDWIAATTAYKLALSVSADDPTIQKESQEAHEKASAILGAQYRKQATYEEKNADWVAAARSWVRAARTLRVDAEAHERAANAIMLAEGNLHEAAKHAQEAIKLAPQKARYHATLAEIYLAAKLVLNAKREAEAAAQMAPDDAIIQALLKKVAKLK